MPRRATEFQTIRSEGGLLPLDLLLPVDILGAYLLLPVL